MTERFTLRPYQEEAIAAIAEARARGVRRMVVCLPTGAGKTVIFSHLASQARGDIIVLAHREELLAQARDKLERALEGRAKVEIEQGELRASPEARVVVCSIRSLRTDRLQRLIAGRKIELVIYDECHHAAAEDNTRVLTELGVFERHWRGALVGFTATTIRGDKQGLDGIFDEIVYTRSILDLIEGGFLTGLRGFRVAADADLTRVACQGGDFDPGELAEAVDIEERNALVARAIQELARDRRTLVFCVTVQHARHLARALRALGVPAAPVHGEMKREDRADVLAQLREGRLQAVTNVGVLTEGFDDPGISCVAMARPTRSEGLYIQCVGRGTRLAPGKKDCLVLDFVDLSDLSLITLPTLFGMPQDLDLQGQEVTEARQFFRSVMFDYPGFEVEAGAISLEEISQRAESFDPLTLEINPEVRAISSHAWCSLGSSGLVLHFHRSRSRLSEALILDSRQRGASRYQVFMDEDNVASFSKVEEAVEAVDYEVAAMGPIPRASARPDADWRQRPVPDAIARKLLDLKPPRRARRLGEAMHYLAFGRYARNWRWTRR